MMRCTTCAIFRAQGRPQLRCFGGFTPACVHSRHDHQSWDLKRNLRRLCEVAMLCSVRRVVGLPAPNRVHTHQSLCKPTQRAPFRHLSKKTPRTADKGPVATALEATPSLPADSSANEIREFYSSIYSVCDTRPLLLSPHWVHLQAHERIRSVVTRTPLDYSPRLTSMLKSQGISLYLKKEHVSITGSVSAPHRHCCCAARLIAAGASVQGERRFE